MSDQIPFRDLFDQASSKYGVPVGILIELVRLESSFDPKAVGDGGKARGLGQFWEGTWKDQGQGPWDNAFKPEYAIPAVAGYLDWLADIIASPTVSYLGYWVLPVIAYNWGIGNVLKWLRTGRPIPPFTSLKYAATILEKAVAWNETRHPLDRPRFTGSFGLGPAPEKKTGSF